LDRETTSDDISLFGRCRVSAGLLPSAIIRTKRVVTVALALALGVPAWASAASTPEQRLAERYAPIVALKQQTAPCDSKGEPYRPVPADTVLDRSDVRLLDASGKVLAQAPSAAVLFGKGENDYLDFPGSPLNAGCSYEKWADTVTAGAPTTSYAHIVSEAGKPGKLALQYWFYYVFNDFNNKHESDWEMIQLMFDASSASEALATEPVEVGFSQHSGAEQAPWSGDKLEKQGTHPVVYPGAGSHANYYSPAVWLGHSAQEGFGCDDTRGPSQRRQTTPTLLPVAAPASAQAPFAWLAYGGHWGQKAGGPNTGPTGPNMKDQWTKPVTWAEDEWRDSSSQVPLTKTLGTSATSFFCGAVEGGSMVYLRFLRTPWFVLGVLAAIALFGVWLSRRTHWKPAPPLPIDERRPGGEIFNAGWAIYRRHFPLFLGIGIVFVPLSALAAILQQAVLSLTGLGTFEQVASGDALVQGVVALLFGQLSTIVGAVLVSAAAAEALKRIDEGGRLDALTAYRNSGSRVGSLAWAWTRIIVVAGLLTITVVGIPLAVVYLVRKAVVTQVCVIEDRDATPSLRRSSKLVRGHGLRVLAIAACVNVTAYLLGPLIGVLFLFLTPSSLSLINVISSLVYVVVMPYVGIAIALLFYDLRRREIEEAALERSPVTRSEVAPRPETSS
jgi:hypothetical protein